MTTLNHSHDKFFKALFTKKDAIREFVQKILPTDVAKRLDVNTLSLNNNQYTDKTLSNHYSDIVYDCVYHTKDNSDNGIDAAINSSHRIDIKLSLLFEHKSAKERHPHLQLLRYVLNIWETQLKQKQPLTPVIPIIFYHGKQVWEKVPLESYFKHTDDLLNSFLPKFDYVLVDTANYDNDTFKQLNVLELQMGLLLMKHIFQTQSMLQQFTDIFAQLNQLLLTEQGKQYFETLSIYLLSNTTLTTDTLVEKMNSISVEAKEKFVSTATQLRMQGIAQGRMEGRMEGKAEGRMEGKAEGRMESTKQVAISMLQENMADSLILKVTQLSQQELNAIKTSLSS